MIRVILWLVFYVLFLGFAGVHVQYRDGLRIDLYNWEERKLRKGKEE